MSSDTMRSSRVVALALVVGTFFTAQEVFMDLARGHSANVPQDVVDGLEIWAVWALLTPLVLAAARRWPLDTKPVSRPLLVHAVLATTLAVVHNVIALGLQGLTRSLPAIWAAPVATAARPVATPMRCQVQLAGLRGFHTILSANCTTLVAFVWGTFIGVLFYAVVVMVYTALRFRSNAATLEAELTRFKLDMLRAQLRPHFLFNTLNASPSS
jgi:DMSO/TMAO reductase YedYZ heme-binding membrane subunit